jgi:hypothetical protein
MAALHLQDEPADNAVLSANLGGQQASVSASIHAPAALAHGDGDRGVPLCVYSRQRAMQGASHPAAVHHHLQAATAHQQPAARRRDLQGRGSFGSVLGSECSFDNER